MRPTIDRLARGIYSPTSSSTWRLRRSFSNGRLGRYRTDTRAASLLPEQRKGWSLRIFCARAPRGLRRMGRERPVSFLLAERTRCSCARSMRAVEDQSAPIPEEITSEIGRRMYVRGSTGSPGKSRMSLFLGLPLISMLLPQPAVKSRRGRIMRIKSKSTHGSPLYGPIKVCSRHILTLLYNCCISLMSNGNEYWQRNDDEKKCSVPAKFVLLIRSNFSARLTLHDCGFPLHHLEFFHFYLSNLPNTLTGHS